MLLGLHAFGASNVLEAGALVAHVASTARDARELARLSGTRVRIVDAGGGLGIPYEPHEESLDLMGLGRGIAAIVGGWATDPWLDDARLLLEPGRFLVGPAGAYVATTNEDAVALYQRVGFQTIRRFSAYVWSGF